VIAPVSGHQPAFGVSVVELLSEHLKAIRDPKAVFAETYTSRFPR
jgi:hypothetical protein